MSQGVGLDFLKSPVYSIFIFKSQTGQHPYNAMGHGVHFRGSVLSLTGPFFVECPSHPSFITRGRCSVSSGGFWKGGIYEALHLTPYRGISYQLASAPSGLCSHHCSQDFQVCWESSPASQSVHTTCRRQRQPCNSPRADSGSNTFSTFFLTDLGHRFWDFGWMANTCILYAQRYCKSQHLCTDLQ